MTLSHVPNHLDCLMGACRPVSRLDGGPVDGVLRRLGGGFQAVSVYPARRSLGRIGQHHVGFDQIEEEFGLSRTYKIEIADTHRGQDVVAALRDQLQVEAAVVQCLSTIPFSAALARDREPTRKLTRQDAWAPHERIHAAEARSIEPGDERVTVGVVDTGVALGSPELQRKLLAGYDTVDLGMGQVNEQLKLVGDSHGHDFNPLDEVGHGSHVAGVIGAHGFNLPEGVGGRSLILPMRVLAAARAADGKKRIGVGALSDINAGMKCCVDLGAKLINMSFGTPASALNADDPLPHGRVVRYAAHYGCVLVAAAGNSGIEEEYYPAALPEVIAIGSVDRHGKRSRFSTFGKHLALCAPGEQIISVGRRGYAVSSGTSHAAPFVCGVAALLVSCARRAGRELNGSDVRRLLIESASPLSGNSFNPETGYGFLNALGALRRLGQTLTSNQPNGEAR
jgi:subtilisin family serine protease